MTGSPLKKKKKKIFQLKIPRRVEWVEEEKRARHCPFEIDPILLEYPCSCSCSCSCCLLLLLLLLLLLFFPPFLSLFFLFLEVESNLSSFLSLSSVSALLVSPFLKSAPFICRESRPGLPPP